MFPFPKSPVLKKLWYRVWKIGMIFKITSPITVGRINSQPHKNSLRSLLVFICFFAFPLLATPLTPFPNTGRFLRTCLQFNPRSIQLLFDHSSANFSFICSAIFLQASSMDISPVYTLFKISLSSFSQVTVVLE